MRATPDAVDNEIRGPARAASAGEATGAVDGVPPARTLRAGVLPADVLSGNELVILLLRPSPLYIPLSCAVSLCVIAMVAFLLAYVARWQPSVGWSDAQAFVVGVALAAMRVAWQALDWYGRVYVLTDRRVVRRMGVLRVSLVEIPLGRVQHTAVFTRVRERIFGLGTIGFASAGSDVFEVVWVTIRSPFAVHRIVTEAIDRYGRGKRG